ncbi:hypothetical protein C8F01DRAFT_1307516 [Mycena amicta]|nr:hypothetical protein C8F01DRAFT_1307516 [Mycena amicta]
MTALPLCPANHRSFGKYESGGVEASAVCMGGDWSGGGRGCKRVSIAVQAGQTYLGCDTRPLRSILHREPSAALPSRIGVDIAKEIRPLTGLDDLHGKTCLDCLARTRGLKRLEVGEMVAGRRWSEGGSNMARLVQFSSGLRHTRVMTARLACRSPRGANAAAMCCSVLREQLPALLTYGSDIGPGHWHQSSRKKKPENSDYIHAILRSKCTYQAPRHETLQKMRQTTATTLHRTTSTYRKNGARGADGDGDSGNLGLVGIAGVGRVERRNGERRENGEIVTVAMYAREERTTSGAEVIRRPSDGADGGVRVPRVRALPSSKHCDDIGDMHMLVIVLLELRDAGHLGKRPNNGPGRGAAAAGAPTSSARSTMGRQSSEWTYFQSVSPLTPFALVLQNSAADYAAH